MIRKETENTGPEQDQIELHLSNSQNWSPTWRLQLFFGKCSQYKLIFTVTVLSEMKTLKMKHGVNILRSVESFLHST